MRLLNSNETNNMEFLTEKGIPFTLIEPTQTGLKNRLWMLLAQFVSF